MYLGYLFKWFVLWNKIEDFGEKRIPFEVGGLNG